MEKKPKRFEPFNDKNWWKSGLIWGVFMFVIMVFAIKPYTDDTYTGDQKLFDLALWVAGGLGYGAIMRWIYRKKQKEG